MKDAVTLTASPTRPRRRASARSALSLGIALPGLVARHPIDQNREARDRLARSQVVFAGLLQFEFGGTRVGPALVERLVRRQGGRVVARGVSGAARRSGSSRPPRSRSVADDVEILLVEDSPADAGMRLRTLRRRGIATRIEHVREALEALEFLLSEDAWSSRGGSPPRLARLDLKMSRMDGLQVPARPERDARTRAIPVMEMGSSAGEGDRLRSYQHAVRSFVVKPVTIDAIARVEADVGMYGMVINKTP